MDELDCNVSWNRNLFNIMNCSFLDLLYQGFYNNHLTQQIKVHAKSCSEYNQFILNKLRLIEHFTPIYNALRDSLKVLPIEITDGCFLINTKINNLFDVIINEDNPIL